VLLAAIPFLRRGDQAARQPDWRNVVQLRPLALSLAVFIGGALVLALLFGGPIHDAINWSSLNLFQSLNLPQT
jgi:hypothetical protein